MASKASARAVHNSVEQCVALLVPTARTCATPPRTAAPPVCSTPCRRGPPGRKQPTILKLQFLYFIGMETIQVTEPQDSDFLGPGLALAPGQLFI